jgi:hypothetical protein
VTASSGIDQVVFSSILFPLTCMPADSIIVV